MKSILLALSAALLLCSGVAAAGDYPPSGESLVYWQSGGSTWKSFDNVGHRTEDTGTMHAIGISSDRTSGKSAWRPSLEMSFGSSDHDVYDASNIHIDDSDSRAFGLRAGVDYLYDIPVMSRSTIRPIVGAEGRWVRRTISDGKAGTYNTYRESWAALNLRLGLQLLFHDSISPEDQASPTGSPRVRFRAEAGLLIPAMLNRHFENSSNISSSNHAGLRPSFYGEFGPALGAFRPVLYYEGLRLLRAPRVSEDTVGIRLGWAF